MYIKLLVFLWIFIVRCKTENYQFTRSFSAKVFFVLLKRFTVTNTFFTKKYAETNHASVKRFPKNETINISGASALLLRFSPRVQKRAIRHSARCCYKTIKM